MCGLFGAIGENQSADILQEIAEQAGRRGPHANGIAWLNHGGINCRKSLGPINPAAIYSGVSTMALIGNCRLGTSGTPCDPANNQPQVVDTVAVSHNGNVPCFAEMAAEVGAKLVTGCDSEVIAHYVLRKGVVETIKRLSGCEPLVLLILSNEKISAYRAGQPLFVYEQDGCHYFCSRSFAQAHILPEGQAFWFDLSGGHRYENS